MQTKKVECVFHLTNEARNMPALVKSLHSLVCYWPVIVIVTVIVCNWPGAWWQINFRYWPGDKFNELFGGLNEWEDNFFCMHIFNVNSMFALLLKFASSWLPNSIDLYWQSKKRHSRVICYFVSPLAAGAPRASLFYEARLAERPEILWMSCWYSFHE